MDYGRIISFGFSNAWKYKSLWILGFFVSAGGGANFNIGDKDRFDFGFGRGYVADFAERILENPLILVLLAAVLLAVILFFVIMGTISIGGLIEAARRFEEKETYHFGQIFGVGVSNFWRLLGILILMIVVVLAVVLFHVLLGVIAFTINWAVGVMSLLILIPTFFILLFIAIATSAMAERLIVIKRRPVFDAIGDGFSLWISNLGPTILYALIYLGISIGVFLATMIVVMFIAMPFVAIGFVNLLVALVFGIPIVLAVLVVMEGFSGSAMHLMTTEFYYQIAARPGGTQTQTPGMSSGLPPTYTPPQPPDATPPQGSPPPESPSAPPPLSPDSSQ